MEPVLIDKLQAINGSKNKKQLLVPRFIKLLLSVSSLGIFLSSPLWLPATISILEAVQAVAFGPKGLFIICNIIIVVLIGESKLCNSFMQHDICHEYAYKNRSFHKLSDKRYNDEAELGIENSKEELKEERYEEVEELNKRVEAFIARVNKQRKLEAKLIVCCG